MFKWTLYKSEYYSNVTEKGAYLHSEMKKEFYSRDVRTVNLTKCFKRTSKFWWFNGGEQNVTLSLNIWSFLSCNYRSVILNFHIVLWGTILVVWLAVFGKRIFFNDILNFFRDYWLWLQKCQVSLRHRFFGLMSRPYVFQYILFSLWRVLSVCLHKSDTILWPLQFLCWNNAYVSCLFFIFGQSF